ncbi:MAG: 4Fe-4S binding protein [Bacteroidales bacterium]|jgi:electron transport complex protein RnfB
MDRRKFLVNFGRATCALAIGGVVYRVVSKQLNPEEAGPLTRYVWAIDPEKCNGCGACETACVRNPSAVKAVNDQKKCSYCVVCYGHISNKNIESDKIMTEGIRVCKYNAVKRENYSGGQDGSFIYTIDDKLCTACGKCVKNCNEKGTRSMFLIIRPDLCLACNSCNIAAKCPQKAIDRVYIGPEDDFKGEYSLENGGEYI